METIADLQRALRDAQQEPSVPSRRLAERNVVAVVAKLVELKLLDVYFTVDGKEYVTPEQLAREIYEELNASGGRLSITDLPTVLRIDALRVEETISSLIRSDPSLKRVENELLTSVHLSSIVDELLELLLEGSGQLSMPEIANRFELPLGFVQQGLIPRLASRAHQHGHRIHIEDQIIFTEGYGARQRAMIKGALSGSTQPVALSDLRENYHLNEALLRPIVDRLIKEKSVDGRISVQDKEYFVPSIVEQLQRRSILGYFQQNGYIDYSRVQQILWTKISVSVAQQFVRKLFGETGITNVTYLETAAVGSLLRDHLDASVESALTSEGFLDLSAIVPPHFSSEDTSLLLKSCSFTSSSAGREKEHLSLPPYHTFAKGMFLATQQKLESIVTGFEDRALRDIQIELVMKGKKKLAATPSKPAIEPNPNPTEQTASKRRNRNADRISTEPEPADQFENDTAATSEESVTGTDSVQTTAHSIPPQPPESQPVSTPGASVPKKPRRRASRVPEQHTRHTTTIPSAKGQTDIIQSLMPKEIELRRAVEIAFEHQADDFVVKEILGSFVKNAVLEKYKEIHAKVLASLKAVSAPVNTISSMLMSEKHKKQLHHRMEEQLQSAHIDLQMYAKGITVLSTSSRPFSRDLSEQLEHSLLRRDCSTFAYNILSDQAMYHELIKTDERTALFELDYSTVPQLLKDLPAEIGSSILLMLNSVRDGVSAFFSSVKNVQDECGYYFRPLDKKHEKSILAEKRQSLKQSLARFRLDADNEACARFFELCIRYLYVIKCGVLLHAVPGKLVSRLIEHLRPILVKTAKTRQGDLPTEQSSRELYEHLSECQHLISQYLSFRSGEPPLVGSTGTSDAHVLLLSGSARASTLERQHHDIVHSLEQIRTALLEETPISAPPPSNTKRR